MLQIILFREQTIPLVLYFLVVSDFILEEKIGFNKCCYRYALYMLYLVNEKPRAVDLSGKKSFF